MGMLSDLVVGPAGIEDRLLQCQDCLSEFAGIHSPGLDPVTLSTLYSILAGMDVVSVIKSGSLVVRGEGNGPWVAALPPEWTTAMASMHPDNLDRVVRMWAETDEIRASPRDYPDMRALLLNMRDIANGALAS